MDARNYINILRGDADRRREEAWLELHRRPDALPLPPEPERPWTERVALIRWLFAAGRVARRVPAGTRRGQRAVGAAANPASSGSLGAARAPESRAVPAPLTVPVPVRSGRPDSRHAAR